MSDRTSAYICNRIVHIIHERCNDGWYEKKMLIADVLNLFQEYDFSIDQAFWKEEEIELIRQYDVCLICGIVDCDNSRCDDKYDEYEIER